MSRITTHVLDTVLGKPAIGVEIRLERQIDERWIEVDRGVTDKDGRCQGLADDARPGNYSLVFKAGAYFSQQGRTSIYPEISVTFRCGDDAHYHLPLLLSDNGYTTYRGS
jgi:5-hydroxyisourate hydrolase